MTLHKSYCTTVPEANYWFFHDIPEGGKYGAMCTGCVPLMSPMTNEHVYGKLPIAYVVCLNDRVLSVEYQEMIISDVEERGAKVVRYDVEGGHEGFLSQTKKCVEAVEDFVGKL